MTKLFYHHKRMIRVCQSRILTFQKSLFYLNAFQKSVKYFLFNLKNSFFVCKIFKFLAFDHVGKWLVKKAKVNFKIFDKIYLTNNYYRHNAQYFKKYRQSDNEIHGSRHLKNGLSKI